MYQQTLETNMTHVVVSPEEETFILTAITALKPPDTEGDPRKNIRPSKHYGINSKWSGLEEAFGLEFNKQLEPALLALERLGKIEAEESTARRGGYRIYLPTYLPPRFKRKGRRAKKKIYEERKK